MEKKQKFSLLGVILASIILASCAGTDTSEEDGANAAGTDASTGAEVTPLSGEELTGGAVDGEEVTGSAEDLDEMLTIYYFDFDQSSLSADTREALDVVAAYLKVSGKTVRLEGHADERGTREYNLALGERRAQAVANYLAVQGVDRDKLELISYGEEKPAEVGSNESSWSKNRRVELVK